MTCRRRGLLLDLKRCEFGAWPLRLLFPDDLAHLINTRLHQFFLIKRCSARQKFVEQHSEAVEIIPRTLAENAGIDPIDILTELKAAHDKGEKWAGIDVFKGKAVDAWKNGVIEPLKIKTQAISSAAEVAVMILRIDDVIAGSGGGKGPEMPPGGMPPGMPPGMGM